MNNVPAIELDPVTQETVEALMSLINEIASGAPVGLILLRLDHSTNQVGVRAYKPGDNYRCAGILLDLANNLMERAKQPKGPGILVPRR